MTTALATNVTPEKDEVPATTAGGVKASHDRVVTGELVEESNTEATEASGKAMSAEAERVYAEFCKPFPSKAVKWRVGKLSSDERRGQALCYIDARNVQNRLDATVGFTNWQSEFREVQNAKGDVVVFICRLGVRIDGEWIYKEDVAEPTDFEAMKGGVSDALKRAASQFGIGRYFYDIPSPWVDLRDGRFFQDPALPDWAIPAEERGQQGNPEHGAHQNNARKADARKEGESENAKKVPEMSDEDSTWVHDLFQRVRKGESTASAFKEINARKSLSMRARRYAVAGVKHFTGKPTDEKESPATTTPLH